MTLSIAIITSVALTAPQRGRAPGLTVAVAQQQMRALPALPVPADMVRVTDMIEVEGQWVATVDFAGTPAHVRFRRAGDLWTPAEMSYQRGWIPLAKGFAIITEAEETGVRSTLRALASGQLTYSAVCATGFFAPTLAVLATPQAGQSDAFILKTMAPPQGETALVKDHYTIQMTAPPSSRSPRSCNGVPAGGSAQTWSATARRQKGFAGKSYKIDADGNLTEIK